MALASSIGKQIAPGVYEDLSKKKTIPQNTGINVDQSQALYGAGLSAPQPTIKQPTETQAPGWIGQPKKVATTQNPVITRSAPAPTPMTPPQTDITSWDDNQIKDFVAWAELNPTELSQEDMFKLKRGNQILQDRAFQQNMIDPNIESIKKEQELRAQKEKELQDRNAQLTDARRRELELTYGKRITGAQEAGQKTMNAAQRVLSFSGGGRSSYAAEKQAEIQQAVNENISILNAERDYAMAQYEAELRGATAEELAGYDANISALRQKSAEFSAQLAQQMNEYNMQTAASYEERINNVLQLAQSLEIVELTPGQQEEAGAYASLLLDNEGNINDKLLADIPPILKGYALRKASEIKANMPKKLEAPETIKGEDGSVYAFNDQTGEFEKIIGGKPMQSDKTVTIKNQDGSTSIMQYNTQSGKYDIPVTPSGFTPNGTPVNQAIQTALEKCKTGAQCGKFVNDVLQGVGLPRLVADSYRSKEMAISQIGIATSYDDMGAGSVFAYPVKGSSNGHIGIITAVNDDGTVDIMDFNYKGDEQRRERQNVNPAEITNMGGRISKPIIRDDTVAQSVEKKPLTKEEKSTLFSIQDDLKTDPRRKEYLTLQGKIKTLEGIKARLDNGTANAQDKQNLISDFAKVLDPTSVVRESEYALAAKYGQSKVDKAIQEYRNRFDTNGPLNDTSAKILAEALSARFESTKTVNDEAVKEQQKRAEIFLGRPVSLEELGVTPLQTTQSTPTVTKVTQKAKSITAKYGY